MAIQTLNTIKNWFKTSLKPSQAQFWDTWDSFRHKFEKVPVKDIDGIDELLLTKADKTILDNHLADKIAHAPQVNTDWNSESGFSQLINKPEFKTINGEEIVGNGNISIESKVPTLQQVGDSSQFKYQGNGSLFGVGSDYSGPGGIIIGSEGPDQGSTISASRLGISIHSTIKEKGTSNYGSIQFSGDTPPVGKNLSYKLDPTKNSGIYTLATKSDFKTINNQSLIGTGDISIDRGNQDLQQTLETGSIGLVSDSVKIGNQSVSGDTYGYINMKAGGQGIDAFTDGVFNLGAKSFLLNSSNGGGFLTSGDAATNQPLRMNSEGSGIEIGGGTGGITIDSQGGNLRFVSNNTTLNDKRIVTSVNGVIADSTGNVAVTGAGNWQTVLDTGSTKVQVSEMQIKLKDSVDNPSRFEMFSPDENTTAFLMSTSRGIALTTQGNGSIDIGLGRGVTIYGGNDVIDINTSGSRGVNLAASGLGSLIMNQSEGVALDARSNPKGVTIFGRNKGITLYGGTGTNIQGGYLKIESPTSLDSSFYINQSSGFVFNKPFSGNPYGSLRMNYRDFTESGEEKEAIQIIGNSYTTDTAYFEKGIKFVNKEFFTGFDATNVATSTTISLPTGTKGNVTLPISVNGILADENGNITVPGSSGDYVEKSHLSGGLRFYGIDTTGAEKMFKMPSNSSDTVLCVDALGTDMRGRSIDKDTISNFDTSIPTSKAVTAAVETRQIKDKQIIINGDIDVQENWNGQTIIFKSSGIVRMPMITTEEFSFNAITLEGVNLTWQWANQIEWVFGEPEITSEKKYFNLTKLGNTNQIILSV